MASCKIILLLDSAKVHSTTNLNLHNTTVHILPSYTTFCIQPMNASIIISFKHHYQSYFIKWLLDKYEAKKDEKMNILDAIRNNIYCFQYTGILPDIQDNEESFISDNDDKLIEELYLDIENIFNYPGEKDIYKVLSNKEILDLTTNLEPKNESTEDDDSTEMHQISHQEALNAVEILEQYIVQNDFSETAKSEHNEALLKSQKGIKKLQIASFKQTSIETYFELVD
ncbi:4777_t:CDS:2 [Cetraspora pellucida]|uniref:4777_t:CDS:1 n=1 Tax=Cetraspora pellucida TaxID=1433469 RepID=A0A9N9G6J4_9GLOM|nr:4777_t:CDS:2 [Cetraspora pellucida]